MPCFIDISKLSEGIAKLDEVTFEGTVNDDTMDLPHLRKALMCAIRVMDGDYAVFKDIDIDGLEGLLEAYFHEDDTMMEEVEKSIKSISKIMNAVRTANPVIGGDLNEFF